MILALNFIPVVLSLVLLGAHFVRLGQPVLVAASVMLILMLFIKRPWVARLIQVILALGALEWVRTTVVLVQIRAAHGELFTRMAMILGFVAAVTIFSALLFQARPLRRHYRL